MTVAVTGPFASGKSTFVKLLGELGAETVSADEIVHNLLARDQGAITRVVERFGEDVLDGRVVDRRALGRRVFGDPQALQDLEDILHPLVGRETRRRIEGSRADLFVAEIPLLFEGGRSGSFDYTVAVTVPEERRRAWAAKRGVDDAALRAIEARQLPQGEKARRADVVVQNDGGLDKLREQAEELRERISRERCTDGSLQRQET
ncbi:MAG TPA: dephospho-CoA kinase [Rubrobacteraceae bacterium]|nr:dephospho-CoA kinase [Rubrobacteraceae bacterium]